MICDFKCPSCGDVLRFDGEEHKLICDTCNSVLEAKDYDYTYLAFRNIETISDELTGFSCPDCNAKIIVSRLQATARCAYCDNEMSTFGLGKDEMSPEKIIPCKLTHDEAMGKLMTWWYSKKTMPKFDPDKLKLTIEEMYVPVWLFDAEVYTRIDAVVAPFESCKEDISIKSDLRKIRKGITSVYSKVPWDGSAKIADEKFHGIEPFDYSELEDFNPSYLAGHVAEKYYFSSYNLLPEIVHRLQKYGVEQCTTYTEADSLGGPIKSYDVDKLDVIPSTVTYALVPIWICSYSYGGKRHQVFVNGQTGKVDGEILFTNHLLLKESVIFALSSFFCHSSIMLALEAIFSKRLSHGYYETYFGIFAFYMLFAVVVSIKPLIVQLQGKHSTTRVHINEEVQYRQGSVYALKPRAIFRLIVAFIGIVIAFMMHNDILVFRYISLLTVIVGIMIATIDTFIYVRRRKRFLKRRVVVDYFQYIKVAGVTEDRTIML